MMKRIDFRFVLLILALDLVLTAAGMGVPIFSIMLGFIVGLLVVRRVRRRGGTPEEIAAQAWLYGLILSAFTFAMMIAVWLRLGLVLLEPNADLAGTGIPQILFSPGASLIGWLVLMIVISPFLQLMSVGFSVFVADVLEARNRTRPGRIPSGLPERS